MCASNVAVVQRVYADCFSSNLSLKNSASTCFAELFKSASMRCSAGLLAFAISAAFRTLCAELCSRLLNYIAGFLFRHALKEMLIGAIFLAVSGFHIFLACLSG